MKENIKIAYKTLREGNAAADVVVSMIEAVKALPRFENNVFDMTSVSGDVYKAGGIVYPFYMYYETKVNGKAGYFDLMDQLRYFSDRIEEEFTLENAAGYLAMMVDSIEAISPEIYELYHELVALFRARMKQAIEAFAGEASSEAKASIGASLEKACGMDLLLSEKYLDTAKSFQA
jgi:hypothetical protein